MLGVQQVMHHFLCSRPHSVPTTAFVTKNKATTFQDQQKWRCLVMILPSTLTGLRRDWSACTSARRIWQTPQMFLTLGARGCVIGYLVDGKRLDQNRYSIITACRVACLLLFLLQPRIIRLRVPCDIP